MDVLILCVYDLRQPTGIRFCRQNTTGGKIRHSLTKGRASMGRDEGDWVSGFVQGPEMGNRVLTVGKTQFKLYSPGDCECMGVGHSTQTKPSSLFLRNRESGISVASSQILITDTAMQANGPNRYCSIFGCHIGADALCAFATSVWIRRDAGTNGNFGSPWLCHQP